MKSSVKWVNKLDLIYKSANGIESSISADVVHAQLVSSGNTIKDVIKYQLEKKQGKTKLLDATGDPKPNFLIVNIGFILSKSNKHGDSFVSLPLKVPEKILYSVQNSWLKGEGKEESSDRIEERHKQGKEHTPQDKNEMSEVTKYGPSHYANNVKGPTYENKFHHSEQAVYEYLARYRPVASLINRFLQTGIEPGTKVLSIVMDMHSTRYVCDNCEMGMQGVMNPQYKFLQYVSDILSENGISYPFTSLSVIPRVTANHPDGKKPKKTEKQHSDKLADRIVNASDGFNKYIYEADTSVYKVVPADTDYHRRTVFISTDVSNKNLYNEKLNALIDSEYRQMIASGMAIRTNTELGDIEVEDTENVLPEQEKKKELDAFNDLATMMYMQDVDANLIKQVKKIVKDTFEVEYLEEQRLVNKLLKIGDIDPEELEKLSFAKLRLIASKELIEAMRQSQCDYQDLCNLSIDELEAVIEHIELLDITDVYVDDIVNFYNANDLDFIMEDDIKEALDEGKISIDDISNLDSNLQESLLTNMALINEADVPFYDFIDLYNKDSLLLEEINDEGIIKIMRDAAISLADVIALANSDRDKLCILKSYELHDSILEEGLDEVEKVYNKIESHRRKHHNYAIDDTTLEEAMVNYFEAQEHAEEITEMFRQSKQMRCR